MRQVFGLVGPIASGKGSVGQILKDLGFEYYSLSDVIREELKKRGLPINRESLQDMGDELRKEFGDGVLAIRTGEKVDISSQTKVVIDSIRNPAEIELLRSHLGAIIIGVTASPEARFKRVLARAREGEPKSWEDFLAMDRRETEKCSDPSKINVTGCLEMANYVITNEGTADDLMDNLRKILKETIVASKEGSRRRRGSERR
ncbi:hypothetical protein A2Y68_01320 [Candidatus Woesebacteria bacterium RBG_13_46_13]|uniref:Dephospho-CoA kinase n=1 Tax=Candidatus Woesebacteria bacterium RBG_13_46_13 TaxID=1802479 RepID=A0A1F7X4T4_9BACT|nr:MAG: hypothetical protein A2Y68_01320 [Candidatus Woesebacteria bacterium RBG_13_46_13]